jgi:hypothetical protein
MNLYVVANKVKVIAAGKAGASYLANRDKKVPIGKDVVLLRKNAEIGFNPRVIN